MMNLQALGIKEEQIHIYEEIDSTNLEAIRFAKRGMPASIELFIADRQSAGRGRLGRTFVSEGGAGIYLSILIPKEKCPSDALTAHTAVALAIALEEYCGIRLGIKWVNDIYLSGKKLAGILVEAITSNDGNILGFVVGMGINVYKNAITSEISDIATSLEHNGILIDDKMELCAKTVKSFLDLVVANTPKDRLLSEYRARSVLHERKIEVLPVGREPYEATALGINPDFTLSIRLPDGSLSSLSSGEVKTKLL